MLKRREIAISSQRTDARSGSFIRVLFHHSPPVLSCLKPRSIQFRRPCQVALVCCGGRSVAMIQGSAQPSDQQAASVQASWEALPRNNVPVGLVDGDIVAVA